jgi:hypothetical protein
VEIPRVAVVATHNRPAELARLLDAIAPQCDAVFVIDNASNPPVEKIRSEDWPKGRGTHGLCWIKVVHDDEQPPNLSRLWNVGLTMAAQYCRESPAYDVAVLNDDAVPPPGWWDAVSGAMRLHGADAACADPFDRLPPGVTWVLDGSAPMTVGTRLAGWAMMLRGEWDGARFDERFHWWCGDDDVSLRARLAGGLVHVGGYPVPNTGADTSTVGVLAEQSGRDMAAFVEKHGRRPW